jgi:hypothetical protein
MDENKPLLQDLQVNTIQISVVPDTYIGQIQLCKHKQLIIIWIGLVLILLGLLLVCIFL